MKQGLLHNESELVAVPAAMQGDIIQQAHEHSFFSVKEAKELIGKDWKEDPEMHMLLHTMNCK